mgnify:CR=1 FL=1
MRVLYNPLLILFLFVQCSNPSSNFQELNCALSSHDVDKSEHIAIFSDENLEPELDQLENPHSVINSKDWVKVLSKYKYVVILKREREHFIDIVQNKPFSFHYLFETSDIIMYQINNDIGQTAIFNFYNKISTYSLNLKNSINNEFIIDNSSIKQYPDSELVYNIPREVVFGLPLKKTPTNSIRKNNYLLISGSIRTTEDNATANIVTNFKSKEDVSLEYYSHHIQMTEPMKWYPFFLLYQVNTSLVASDKFISYIWNLNHYELEVKTLDIKVMTPRLGLAEFYGQEVSHIFWHPNTVGFNKGWQKGSVTGTDKEGKYHSIAPKKTGLHMSGSLNEYNVTNGKSGFLSLKCNSKEKKVDAEFILRVTTYEGKETFVKKIKINSDNENWQELNKEIIFPERIDSESRFLFYIANHAEAELKIKDLCFTFNRKQIGCILND